jgi:hypothetical protein
VPDISLALILCELSANRHGRAVPVFGNGHESAVADKEFEQRAEGHGLTRLFSARPGYLPLAPSV